MNYGNKKEKCLICILSAAETILWVIGTLSHSFSSVGFCTHLTISHGDQSVVEADVVLVSAGRTPFTSRLGLENIGIETDKIGRILVDERFSTNVKGIFVIGDVIPGPMLAHKVEEDGIACVEYIVGKEGHVDYDKVPGVCYTHPDVLSVGKTEEQAKQLGIAYRVGKFLMLGNSRAKSIDDAEGLVKIITEKETDKVIGVHISAQMPVS